MASRVYLHVGAATTGAAYLRRTLAHHRRRLARLGVLHPASHLGHHGGHAPAVLDALELSRPGGRAAVGAWDRLAETVRDWRRGTAVLSHELLAEAEDHQVARIVGSLGDAETHLVYVVGNLADQVPRAWQSWVRNGGTAGFEGYVGHVAARDEHRSSRVFWRSHDLPALLQRWGRHVPPEQVHLVTAPTGVGGHTLWQRFAAATGLDVDLAGVPDREEPLLGLAEVEVLRLLNAETTGRQAPARMARVRGALAVERSPLPAVPREQEPWLRKETDALLEVLESGRHHVIGEPADVAIDPADLADDPRQVRPAPADVIRAQTRALAAATSRHGDGRGPAGLHRRALGKVARLPRLSRP